MMNGFPEMFPKQPSIFGRLMLGGFILGIIMLFISAALLQWLWNITITRIFNVREITFWEAFRLMIIAGLLFGNGFGLNLKF